MRPYSSRVQRWTLFAATGMTLLYVCHAFSRDLPHHRLHQLLLARRSRFGDSLDALAPELGSGDRADRGGSELGAAFFPIGSEEIDEVVDDPRAGEGDPADGCVREE